MYFNSLFLLYGRNKSISQCRKGCAFSHTSNVVFHKFKLSRHCFKELASDGFLSGLRKSSF